MKTEEWQAKLMDYLYDEMAPHEKLAFEQELKENSALKEELRLLENDQSTLSKWEDEPASAPPFFQVYQKSESKNKANGLKWFMAVAASIILLMVAARLTEFNVNYNADGKFQLAFGHFENTATEINASQVEDLISKSLASYDEKMEEERALERQDLKNQLIASQDNQKQLVNNYVKALEDKHAQLMQVYWTENTKQQQVYMQNLLTDFAGYMEEQRSEDLNYIIAKLELMETDKELFKLETGEIINSLANNTENSRAY